jgi:alpha-1,6-mannosyltransferase
MHLLDTTLFFARQSGGVKRYLMAKHAWLKGQPGVRHTLLVPGRRNIYVSDENLFMVNSPVIPFAHGSRLPINLAAFARAIEQLQPDLIEAEDPYQLAWTAIRTGKKLGIPVLGYYHSDLPQICVNRFGAKAGKAAANYIAQLYRRFDLVLAPSRAMVSKLAQMGVENVRHQPLGVNTDEFHPRFRDPGLRASLGLPADTRLLVFAGRFSPEKKLPVLLETMERLGPPYHLLLVGGGMHLSLPDNASIIPFQSNSAELARLLASSDMLVHPGDQETFGLIIIEAMSCGLPIVGMAASGVAELVSPEMGRLVPPGDSLALAEAIDSLYQQDLVSMGAAARQRAETLYSWNVVMAQLLAIYQDVVYRMPPALEPVVMVRNAYK